LFLVPSKFSIWLSAVQKVGLQRELQESKGLTVFVPTNAAWENIGFQNLMYLFCEENVKDLKQVIQYHLTEKLVYADEMMEQEKLEIPTKLKGEKIVLRISHKKDIGGRWEGEEGDDWEDFRGGRQGKQCPAEHIFALNNGQSSIVVRDGLE
jgi:hypothetical protein